MEQEGRAAAQVRDLHRTQLQEWEVLARGHRYLAGAVRRSWLLDGWQVEIQLNLGRDPGRRDWIGPESPGTCFLCVGRRPQGQRWLWARSWEVLCNPAPLFPEHFTLVWPEHGRRSLSGHLEDLFELALDFGPTYTFLYNGPRAGASAPDHLHFQAFTAGLLPLERALMGEPEPGSGVLASWSEPGLELRVLESLGRGVLLGWGRERRAVVGGLARALLALGQEGAEADVNLLARAEGGRLVFCLFPRRAHRPACFSGKAPGQVRVSPGAADLAGLLILTREQDLDLMTPDLIRRVYQEVAWEGAHLVGRLSRGRSGA